METEPGSLPLLAPMSEVAGRLAPHAGAYFLERMNGGKGKLLGGVTGVAAARVVVLGGGIAGSNAAMIAAGHAGAASRCSTSTSNGWRSWSATFPASRPS